MAAKLANKRNPEFLTYSQVENDRIVKINREVYEELWRAEYELKVLRRNWTEFQRMRKAFIRRQNGGRPRKGSREEQLMTKIAELQKEWRLIARVKDDYQMRTDFDRKEQIRNAPCSPGPSRHFEVSESMTISWEEEEESSFRVPPSPISIINSIPGEPHGDSFIVSLDNDDSNWNFIAAESPILPRRNMSSLLLYMKEFPEFSFEESTLSSSQDRPLLFAESCIDVCVEDDSFDFPITSSPIVVDDGLSKIVDGLCMDLAVPILDDDQCQTSSQNHHHSMMMDDDSENLEPTVVRTRPYSFQSSFVETSALHSIVSVC